MKSILVWKFHLVHCIHTHTHTKSVCPKIHHSAAGWLLKLFRFLRVLREWLYTIRTILQANRYGNGGVINDDDYLNKLKTNKRIHYVCFIGWLVRFFFRRMFLLLLLHCIERAAHLKWVHQNFHFECGHREGKRFDLLFTINTASVNDKNALSYLDIHSTSKGLSSMSEHCVCGLRFKFVRLWYGPVAEYGFFEWLNANE